MVEFYAEAAYPLNHRRAAEAFASLLADDRLGHVWFIQADSKDVGRVVVTLCFSMEYGGVGRSASLLRKARRPRHTRGNGTRQRGGRGSVSAGGIREY